MRLLELTLPTHAENLALDEALLEEAESFGQPCETLRLWEPRSPLVVVGRSSQLAGEVRLERCRRLGIPVLRRISGGAAVVTGPGCLMYALVLSLRWRSGLGAVDQAHRLILGTIAAALAQRLPGIRCQGTSDLTVDGKKFSGNSLRCKRGHLLYHGTLLYDFPLELVEQCLAMPPRQPAYRAGRVHAEFVANLPLDASSIRDALCAAWAAGEVRSDWPADLTARLAAEKYAQSAWNEQR